MPEIDHIEIVPDTFGWLLKIKTEVGYYEFGIGDAIQFHAETERTIGKWLADGPDDFHNSPDPPLTLRHGDGTPYMDVADYLDPDLARDIEREK